MEVLAKSSVYTNFRYNPTSFYHATRAPKLTVLTIKNRKLTNFGPLSWNLVWKQVSIVTFHFVLGSHVERTKQWNVLVDKKNQDRDHTCRKLVSIGGAAILLILLPYGRRPEFGVLFVVIAQTQIIRQLTHNFASPVLKGRSRFRRIHILLMFNCRLALLSPKPKTINRLVSHSLTDNKKT